MDKVIMEIARIVEQVKRDQRSDGSWGYALDTGISTDAHMIVLLRTLKFNDEELIKALTKRIISKQEENGAWKLFHDEKNGNLSITIEAYYALLYSGYFQKEDLRLQLAKKYILRNGGLEASKVMTKILLAITGQYEWPKFFPIPIEAILLPVSFPINFFDISVFGRAHLTPALLLFNRRFQVKRKNSPDLSDLILNRSLMWEREYGIWSGSTEWRSLFPFISYEIKSLIGLPDQLHKLAVERAKQYMLERIEPDGTLYSYFYSTFYMIFALYSLGHQKNDPIILKAMSGLKGMSCHLGIQTHIQLTTATVWNTSLLSHALQEVGIPSTDPTVVKANLYLLSRQYYLFGDWAIHNPEALPGGWGFSDINTMNPDIDDTSASLRAIKNQVKNNSGYQTAWNNGIQWLLTMQNEDGGWPSFEKKADKKLYYFIPVEGAEYYISDPSTADLTGRTLEFFGNYTQLPKKHPIMTKGSSWLLKNQETDGSWYGRWGICYIYGTWAALTGLASAGYNRTHPSIQKAVTWLHNIQNSDGGWGESCHSDIKRTYVPLKTSTKVQTAWALDALISVAETKTPEIEAGINYLIKQTKQEHWTNKYPTGQGLAGGVYMYYESYQYIYPLLALANFKKKFS